MLNTKDEVLTQVVTKIKPSMKKELTEMANNSGLDLSSLIRSTLYQLIENKRGMNHE
jgi:antitoxin component of RelBE/YafQ-DinJ toxin-antitoxin module